MVDPTVVRMDTPLSPLSQSDDLLAALDEMLGFTSETAATMDSLVQRALDTSYVADAFEFPEVPNPYEQQPREEVAQTAGPVPIVTTQATQQQEHHQQSAQQKRNARATPYPTAKPQRRKRPKDELDYLRAKAANLEQELANLNRSTRRFSSVLARWKLVAERQKEEANKTIVENLKLRAILKGQIEIAKRRREMVMADYQQQQALPSWNLIRTKVNLDVDDADDARRPRAPSISDEMIFAELNGSLEAQYAQVGSLLQASGIANVNRELLGKIQLKQDLDGISFGLQEVRLMPFAVQAVARATWSLLEMVPGRTQIRIINNNHLIATIVDTLQLPKSQRTKVSFRFAMCRYFEDSRMVVVWSGCVEIAGSVFVRLREKGFVVVSSFDFTGGELSSARPEGFVARSVINFKPETVEFRPGADTNKHIGEMTDLVIGTCQRTCIVFNQVMENLLLQDLMRSSA